MAKEFLDGTQQQFFVGSDAPADSSQGASLAQNPNANYNPFTGQYSLPPVAGQTPMQVPQAGSAPSITSSFVFPSFQNYQQALGEMAKHNQNLFPLGQQAIYSQQQAGGADIKAQVARGMQQLDLQAQKIQEQTAGAKGDLSAQLAAASPFGGRGSTAAADYGAAIQARSDQSLALVNQAKQLLQLSGTAEEAKVNSAAASQLMQLAQNQMQNTLQLAQAGYSAATDFANMQLQAQSYGLQVDQYAFAKQQYANSLGLSAKQFALDNGIKSPFYSIGGVVFDSGSGLPLSNAEQAAAAGVDVNNWSNVQKVEPGSQLERQFVMNVATSYPDAGITPQDDMQSVQKKLLQSKIYKVATTRTAAGNGYVGTFQQTPIKNKDGQWIGFRLFNSTTGQTQFVDTTGKRIDPATLPEGYSISTVSSYNSDPMDAAFSSMLDGTNLSTSPSPK